jgi:hypothetical protein
MGTKALYEGGVIAWRCELPLIWIDFLHSDLSVGIRVTPVYVSTWCSSQFMEEKKGWFESYLLGSATNFI